MKRILLLTAMLLMTFAAMYAEGMKNLIVKADKAISKEEADKVKGNIRCVAGVKKIRLNNDQVLVVFDSEKADSKKIVNAFNKIGMKVTVVSETKSEKPAVDGESGATQQQKKTAKQ